MARNKTDRALIGLQINFIFFANKRELNDILKNKIRICLITENSLGFRRIDSNKCLRV